MVKIELEFSIAINAKSFLDDRVCKLWQPFNYFQIGTGLKQFVNSIFMSYYTFVKVHGRRQVSSIWSEKLQACYMFLA